MSLTEPLLAFSEPIVLTRVRDAWAWADDLRARSLRIALVPTMGALHEGHVSLVRLAGARADRVVVSIFVNPTQFGPNEDFARYPRDLAGDLAKLRGSGVDCVFAPEVREMYSEGDATRVDVDRLTEPLCGRARPGHFRGVTTVVARLLCATKPHLAVFGAKDFQQLAVVRRMARDLRLDVEIVGAPIVREPDGLAMSSRNVYLRPAERLQATSLNAGLLEALRLFRAGERDALRLAACARARIEKEPLAAIEYAEVRDVDTLEQVTTVSRPAVLALAVRFGATRLIDNTVLDDA